MAGRSPNKSAPRQRKPAAKAAPAGSPAQGAFVPPAAEPRADAWHESLLVGRVKDLAEIGLRLDVAATEQEILATLRKEARWLVEHERAFAVLPEEDEGGYTLHDLAPSAPFAKLHERRFPAGEGMAGWVIRHSAPIFVRIDACPAFSPAIEGELAAAGIASLLAIPVRTGGEVLGALLFCSAHPAGYHDPDMWVAQILAQQVARALRTVRRGPAASRSVSALDGFSRVARAIHAESDEEAMLKAAVEALAAVARFRRAFGFSVAPGAREALFVARAGEEKGGPRPGIAVPLHGTVLGRVMAQRRAMTVKDARRERLPLTSPEDGMVSIAAAPLIVDGEPAGVLAVGDAKAGVFDAADLALLEAAAGQLAASIRSARLLERARGTNAQLLELDRLKSDFISIVSHDFRSPLASIILAAKGAQRLEPDTPPEVFAEQMGIIVDQATRLSQLAEDTLSITRIESGQLTYHFTLVDLGAAIASAVAAVPPGRRHTIETTVDPAATRARADASKVRQVIQNLVSNAVRYSPAGGKVVIRTRDAGKEGVEVSVSDEGIGIPEDQMGRLFQKFSRVDSPEGRTIKGAGLGLWICREIVQAHGGRIWAERNPARGTTFRFILQKP